MRQGLGNVYWKTGDVVQSRIDWLSGVGFMNCARLV
ncbi:MAG: hypothetical protein FD177_16 [Desulfovibrionaceae bacterium]|nr:MAG: hypothetical protein FD177_16 [Desulfovibrionaceae bacterium]